MRPYDSVEGGLARATAEAADGTRVAVADRWRAVDELTVEVERRATDRAGRLEPGRPARAARDDVLRRVGLGVLHPGRALQAQRHRPRRRRGLPRDVRAGPPRRPAREPGRAGLLPRRALRGADAGRPARSSTRRSPTLSLLERHFVQDTDIGSLGLAPARRPQSTLRASYPFAEERSFCLNTAGDGWAAYVPNTAGRELTATYRLRLAPAASTDGRDLGHHAPPDGRARRPRRSRRGSRSRRRSCSATC